jgi:peptidoglycan hydrolase-like protein with peptidoglycan-binding domain
MFSQLSINNIQGHGGAMSEGGDADFVTLRPSQSIGRYRIISVLGQGGFGITYRALDSELGREVAIKEYLPAALAVRQGGMTVLPRSKSAADDFAWGRERFVAEGRTLAALHRASGIVRVHDFLEENGTAYLVMELLAGETLHERVARRGTLDAQEIDRILGPLLDGLAQVHAAGFLHRDIKPSNILLDDEGSPTLIDFGAARAAVAGRSQALTAVFTPGYASVEQFTSAPQGPWTDIYGLAATLHHAITGKAPPNSVDRMLDDAYAPLAGSNRPYPPGLLAGIDAGLAVRAAERPQSIAEWRTALAQPGAVTAQATVVMRGPPSAATTVGPPPVTARRKWPAVMVAAGALVVVVLAGGWFAFTSGPSDPSPSRQAVVAELAAPGPVAAQVVTAAPQPSVQDRAREELEQARREQQAALEEAARLRAEVDARRKADEEAALRRRIEDELRQKADAEEAARQEEKRRAAAEAAARLKAEETDRKPAEAGEAALRLTQVDRQRLQIALSALGFTTGGTDGVFGPRSREMIAAWQKNNGRAATGYVSADTQAALLREAAPALARYDEEQKRAAASAGGRGGGQCEGTWRSQWCRGAYQGFPPNCWNATMTVRNGEISDGWTSMADRTQRNNVTGRIDASGNVTITYDGIGAQTHVNQRFTAYMSGRVVDGILTAAGRAGSAGREFSVRAQCR